MGQCVSVDVPPQSIGEMRQMYNEVRSHYKAALQTDLTDPLEQTRFDLDIQSMRYEMKRICRDLQSITSNEAMNLFRDASNFFAILDQQFQLHST